MTSVKEEEKEKMTLGNLGHSLGLLHQPVQQGMRLKLLVCYPLTPSSIPMPGYVQCGWLSGHLIYCLRQQVPKDVMFMCFPSVTMDTVVGVASTAVNHLGRCLQLSGDNSDHEG